jgi:hypothetical protein
MNPPPAWFVGAWRRRSIALPGGQPTEPCEAWWLQTDETFVDLRITRPGHEGNGLPFSSTRGFAGHFEIVDDGFRWHLELDSDGLAPRTDGSAGVDLYLDPGDPLTLIEDAPGRFREEWVQQASLDRIESIRTRDVIAVRIGDIRGAVWIDEGVVAARVWSDSWSIAIGPHHSIPTQAEAWR